MDKEREEFGVIVNSTRSQIEDFKSSVLWQDMQRELKFWSEGFNREMKTIVDDAASNNPSTASVLLHMGDLNGRVKSVEYFLSILEIFLDVLDMKKEEMEMEDEDIE
jgi:hypothetical protein